MSQDSAVTAVKADDARVALGNRVRQVRAIQGLSLRQLAIELDVSPATLSAIENGRTGISAVRLAKIAELLGASVDQLLGLPGHDALPPPPVATIADVAVHWRDFPPLEMDQVLTGSLNAFLRIGYHGATMRDIAKGAGLSVPGVYHHYASKQDMLVAILTLTMDDLLARCNAARAEGSGPVERFKLVVECIALFHTHRRELGFMGASEMRSLEPDKRAAIAESRVAVQRIVDHEVEAAHAQGLFLTDLPHEASRAVVTMCTSLANWFHPGGPATAEQVARQYVGFALDLVRYPGNTS